jgi:hypothetical protein
VGRAAALLVVAALVGAYYAAVPHLPSARLWYEIAWLAFVVIPTVCALVLVVLPLSETPLGVRGGIMLAFVALALLFGLAGLPQLANFAKLGAMTFFGWVFLAFIEDVSWVVIIACVIPWVDAYSVWRGPTKHIVKYHEHVFSTLSFTYPVPNGATHLGLPDLFFFAVFLGAAQRFRLRVLATWACLSLSFGATLAISVWWGVGGLPALPLLAVGFLAPNADLLWRRLRGSPAQIAVD